MITMQMLKVMMIRGVHVVLGRSFGQLLLDFVCIPFSTAPVATMFRMYRL